jgi:hypothetical protein
MRNGEPEFESICECFDVEDAERIVAALNAAEEGIPESFAEAIADGVLSRVGDPE